MSISSMTVSSFQTSATTDVRGKKEKDRSAALELCQKYLHTIIIAMFFFTIVSEVGWIESISVSIQKQSLARKKKKNKTEVAPSLASAAANLAATSMTLGRRVCLLHRLCLSVRQNTITVVE